MSGMKGILCWLREIGMADDACEGASSGIIKRSRGQADPFGRLLWVSVYGLAFPMR